MIPIEQAGPPLDAPDLARPTRSASKGPEKQGPRRRHALARFRQLGFVTVDPASTYKLIKQAWHHSRPRRARLGTWPEDAGPEEPGWRPWPASAIDSVRFFIARVNDSAVSVTSRGRHAADDRESLLYLRGIPDYGFVNDGLGDQALNLAMSICPPFLCGLLVPRNNYITTGTSDLVADKRCFQADGLHIHCLAGCEGSQIATDNIYAVSFSALTAATALSTEPSPRPTAVPSRTSAISKCPRGLMTASPPRAISG
jgi:hypothetical protein